MHFSIMKLKQFVLLVWRKRFEIAILGLELIRAFNS